MKSVPFGPVRVKSDADVKKLLKGMKGPSGLKLHHVVVTIVPIEKPVTKKPTVAFQPYWDWSGFSFWG